MLRINFLGGLATLKRKIFRGRTPGPPHNNHLDTRPSYAPDQRSRFSVIVFDFPYFSLIAMRSSLRQYPKFFRHTPPPKRSCPPALCAALRQQNNQSWSATVASSSPTVHLSFLTKFCQHLTKFCEALL